VHYGGKRKAHAFRVLYDYYHKRIDYGDGEFPSKWPSEIEQDDIEGWQLRVEPLRDPSQTDGAWQQYIDQESGREFYYNTETQESTYDRPAEFTEASVAITSATESEWTEHIDENTNQPYYFNSKTGESSFDKPHSRMAMAAQEPTDDTVGSSWTKHFDEEYQVDYYYNHETGESTYDPPGEA